MGVETKITYFSNLNNLQIFLAIVNIFKSNLNKSKYNIWLHNKVNVKIDYTGIFWKSNIWDILSFVIYFIILTV